MAKESTTGRRRSPPRGRRSLDLDAVRTYPLRRRSSKVAHGTLGAVPSPAMSLESFLDSLPNVLAAADLRTVAQAIARRRRRGRLVVLGMGAHPIKVGLSPLIIEWMRRGLLSALAVNGAAVIHDFELAYHGATSEDVGAGLADGSFGMAADTGRFLNRAIAAHNGRGLGRAVGDAILAADLRYADLSLLAAAVRYDVPLTVHVAVGTDIIHMHPDADGAAIGAASLDDFRRLAGVLQDLRGGVFLNLGSAVIIPEVFVKALNLARNVGNRADDLVTVDMDFVRHYRPRVNVLDRPTQDGGRSFQFVGHHEIMFPLLSAAVFAALDAPPRRRPAHRRSAE